MRGRLAVTLALSLVIVPASDFARQGTGPAPPDSFEVLGDLIATYGVSGYEGPVREKVRAYLPEWTSPEVDDKGNLTVTFGSGDEHLVFVAHLDETGYVVASIEDDGTLLVDKRGGFYDRYYEARAVLVHTRRGPVSGIVMPRSGYSRRAEADAEFTANSIRVYLGTDNRKDTESIGIRTGDSITVPKQLVPLANGYATARSFDDRSGCTALLLALMGIDPSTVTKRITFAWVVEEEIGLIGAREVAARTEADSVFAVDTFVSSDSPREDLWFADTPIGNGFVIRALDTSSVTPTEFVDRVIGIARGHNIPVQVGTTNVGNDGSAFTPYGTVDIPIGWPLRYSHSPVEVIAQSDLDARAAVIRHLVAEF